MLQSRARANTTCSVERIFAGINCLRMAIYDEGMDADRVLKADIQLPHTKLLLSLVYIFYPFLINFRGKLVSQHGI